MSDPQRDDLARLADVIADLLPSVRNARGDIDLDRLEALLALLPRTEVDGAMVRRTLHALELKESSDASPAWRAAVDAVRRIRATLLDGSDPVLAGVRGSSTSDVRTYHAERWLVAIELHPTAGGGRALAGQLLPREAQELETGWTAVVETDAGEMAAPVSDTGDFVIPELPGEPRSLVLARGAVTIEVDLR